MQDQSRALRLLAVLGYIMAFAILVAGLVFTIGIVSGGAQLDGTSMGLQMLGLDALSGLIVGPLRRALFTAGTVAFAMTILLSGLVYALARLLAIIRDLSIRVSALEASMAGPAPTPPQAP